MYDNHAIVVCKCMQHNGIPDWLAYWSWAGHGWKGCSSRAFQEWPKHLASTRCMEFFCKPVHPVQYLDSWSMLKHTASRSSNPRQAKALCKALCSDLYDLCHFQPKILPSVHRRTGTPWCPAQVLPCHGRQGGFFGGAEGVAWPQRGAKFGFGIHPDHHISTSYQPAITMLINI